MYNPTGATLALEDNCFVGNQVYASGLVDARKKSPKTVRNYVKVSDEAGDDRCGFVAIFLNESPRRCIESDSVLYDDDDDNNNNVCPRSNETHGTEMSGDGGKKDAHPPSSGGCRLAGVFTYALLIPLFITTSSLL